MAPALLVEYGVALPQNRLRPKPPAAREHTDKHRQACGEAQAAAAAAKLAAAKLARLECVGLATSAVLCPQMDISFPLKQHISSEPA